MRLLLWGERRGKNLPVLSSGFLLGKRRLEGRGMASKREEVVFLPWGNLLQTAKGALQHFGQRERGGKSGGNRTGVSNLQQANAEVGRCA